MKEAERVLEKLDAAFERLARHPEIGHRREELTKDEQIRFWSAGPTLIAYRFTNEVVEILFVERAEQDWERILSGQP